MSSSVIPFSSAISQLGLGYDSTNGQVKGSPFGDDVAQETVVFHTNRPDEDGPEQLGVQYKMRFIESRSDLAETLDISGKFSGKKGNISGSLGGGYLDQQIDTKSNAYLLITVEVTHSVAAISGTPVLSPEKVPGHSSAADGVNESTFFERFGDGYIAAIEIGGRLDGLVEISAESSSDLTRIKAEGKVQIKGLASGEVSLDYVVGKLTDQRQARVTVNAVGGGIGFSPMDARSFVHLAKTFPIMISGGAGKTVEFQIEYDDNDEVVQKEVETDVNFAGNAVPVRAVVRSYKSLPIFSYAPPEVARLASYITDYLIEYYLGQDDAKSKITDLIENSTGDFQANDLIDLDEIRGNVRIEQSKILSAINNATGTYDITVAKDANKEMLQQTPGEIFLLQANKIAAMASRRQELIKLEKLAQERRISTLKQAAKQRFREYSSNVIEFGDFKIFNDDRIAIRSSGSNTSLVSATGSSIFLIKRSDEDITLWKLRQRMSMEDAKMNVEEFSDDALALLHQQYLDLLRTKLSINEISLEEYFEKIGVPSTLDETRFWSLATSFAELWTGELRDLAKQGRDVVLTADDVDTDESFFVEIVNVERKVVRIRNDQNLYWRLTLQWLRHPVLTLEPIGADLKDESFMFQLTSTGDSSEHERVGVTIQPENGALGLNLTTNLPDEHGSIPSLITAPLSDQGDTESDKFEITVIDEAEE